MKKSILLFILPFIFLFSEGLFGQEKVPISHSDYDSWKELSSPVISTDGKFVSYTINPFKGDGRVFLYNVERKTIDTITRGANPKFSENSEYLIYTIKPQFDTVRAAKLKKLKKDKLPKDSLGIYIIKNGRTEKIPGFSNYQIPEQNSNWLAILCNSYEVEKCNKNTKSQDSSDCKLSNSDMKKQNCLLLFNPIENDSIHFEHVIHYAFSKKGSACAIVQVHKDSIDSVLVSVFYTNEKYIDTLFFGPGYAAHIAIDDEGNQLSYSYSTDTVCHKKYDLYHTFLSPKKPKIGCVSCDQDDGIPPTWSVSKHGKMFFNGKGTELYFGTAPIPPEKPKDTLTEDEIVKIDIWNWKDPYLQSQQLKQLEKEKKRAYQAVYFPKKDYWVQLGNEDLQNVKINKKASGQLSLANDNQLYRQQLSWDGSAYRDYYLINRENGSSKKVLEGVASTVSLSVDQKYILWYAITDSSWYAYNIKEEESKLLTRNLNIHFYNEQNDVPNEARPYGFAGWTEDGYAVVYDMFDLWKLDPDAIKKPENITGSVGRNSKLKLRYVRLDKELQSLPQQLLLSAFDKKTKHDGFYRLDLKTLFLQKLVMEDGAFNSIIKAKHADSIIWRKQSFEMYPDLYVSDMDFDGSTRISHTNPQQANFLWGSVELVHWKSFNGDSLSGLLYKPADFNPDKKYPMLVYFYERYADRLHRHIVPKPIRSVINFSYYTSNGYLIFVPDIIYETGYPGPSAFNCVVSGTKTLLDQYTFIDEDHLGIQGQSWGGYQTAYIITQTDMYKAAMAGAPVSNMTSAYGGIRWGSGRSRAFQYEETQSRIGATLWERRDLYILNSPLFFADQVQTPLLMMHNDKDGAVPWYQGIEFFNALRRLHKPTWLLVYNGAPHNLKRKADMEDLSRRMQQFFDHYLKDALEPVWMKEGVPALNKGKQFGFEFD